MAQNETPIPSAPAAPIVHTDSAIAQLHREHGGESYNKYKLDSMTAANRHDVTMATVKEDVPLPGIIGVFIPIIAILGAFVVVYKSIEAKRAVKLALIEKGLDASMLAEPTNEDSKKYSALRYGLLLCGLGLGLIVGITATKALFMDGRSSVFMTIASATLGGGLGMVAYHLMVRRADQK